MTVGAMKTSYASIRPGNRRREASYWSQGRRFLTAVSVGLLLVVFALLYVWSNHRAVSIGYRITELQREQMNLLDMNHQLKIELANLNSLSRLDRVARQKLGLAPPRPDQVVVME